MMRTHAIAAGMTPDRLISRTDKVARRRSMDAVYFEQFTANKFGNSHRGSAKREVAHLFAGAGESARLRACMRSHRARIGF